MVIYDFPRDRPWCYQVYLAFSIWSWSLFQIISMYVWPCGDIRVVYTKPQRNQAHLWLLRKGHIAQAVRLRIEGLLDDFLVGVRIVRPPIDR